MQTPGSKATARDYTRAAYPRYRYSWRFNSFDTRSPSGDSLGDAISVREGLQPSTVAGLKHRFGRPETGFALAHAQRSAWGKSDADVG
jgi:hypothetical protein